MKKRTINNKNIEKKENFNIKLRKKQQNNQKITKSKIFFENIKHTIQFQLLIASISLLFLFIFIYLIIGGVYNSKNLQKKHGNYELSSIGLFPNEEKIYLEPQNCSNQSLERLWGEIFYESFDGAKINLTENPEKNGECYNYFIMKNKSNGELWILIGFKDFYFLKENKEKMSEKSYQSHMILAIHSLFNESYIENVDPIKFIILISNTENKSYLNYTEDRVIRNTSEAKKEFEKIFNIKSQNWYSKNFNDEACYRFNESNILEDKRIRFENTKSGILNKNKTLDMFFYEFENLTIPYAKIKKEIGNITIYNNNNNNNKIKQIFLPSYFIYSNQHNISLIGNIQKNKVKIFDKTYLIISPEKNKIENFSFRINISYKGQQEVLTNKTFVFILNPEELKQNHPPKFNLNCKNITIDLNKTNKYIFDFEKCFEDLDKDKLSFSFYNNLNEYNKSLENISIQKNGTKLILTVYKNFTRTEYFFVVATDNKLSTEETVDIFILGTENEEEKPEKNEKDNQLKVNLTEKINKTKNIEKNVVKKQKEEEVKIINTNKPQQKIEITKNQDENIIITAQNYDKIEWYLDNKLIKTDDLKFNLKSIEEGKHHVKVKVIGKKKIDTKEWNLIIKPEKPMPEKSLNLKKMIFVIIIILIIVVISLFIWILLIEKNKQSINGNYFENNQEKNNTYTLPNEI